MGTKNNSLITSFHLRTHGLICPNRIPSESVASYNSGEKAILDLENMSKNKQVNILIRQPLATVKIF